MGEKMFAIKLLKNSAKDFQIGVALTFFAPHPNFSTLRCGARDKVWR